METRSSHLKMLQVNEKKAMRNNHLFQSVISRHKIVDKITLLTMAEKAKDCIFYWLSGGLF